MDSLERIDRLQALSPEKRRLLLDLLQRDAARSAAARSIPRRSEPGPAPLSFAQQRLWVLDRLIPGSPAYNLPFAVRLLGPLDVPALVRSLGEIVRRHEILRTRIAEIGGEPVQIVEPVVELGLPVVDLAALPADAREAAAHGLIGEEARRPFDLGRVPLLRVLLARLEGEGHLLLLTMHHVVSDAWSMGNFQGELAALYDACVAGRPSPLPALPVQYADFAVWQRGWLQGEVLARHLAAWRERLAGIPELLELPWDRPRPAVQSLQGAVAEISLDRELTEGVGRLARESGASRFMVLLAAFQALLGRLSGREDVPVGSPIANRTRPELEPLIGFFVNTLVLRGDLAGEPSFAELLERVKRVTQEAYEHQDLPFERMVDALAPARTLSHTPLFQVVFALQNAPEGDLAAGGLRLVSVAAHSGNSKFDLELSLGESEGRLLGVLEYSTDLFDATTMERWLGAFQRLLAQVVADPGRRVWEVPLLSGVERQQILEEWGGARGAWPPRECLHELFAAQVARRPDAVAAVCGDEALSYRELDLRAGRLAARIAAAGVRPGEIVGLCAQRSLGLAVGILGILKAGAAYLPLDPAQPADRHLFQLEDAGASVLVTGAGAPELPGFAGRALALDAGAGGAGLAGVRVPPAAPAYVIYTSGSTGRPKGVVVSHANVLRLFAATDSWFGFGPDDVWTLFHSFTFDFSVWEIWGALLHGGRLVVVPYLVSRSPEAFLDLLAREGVTVLNQTPSAFRQLIAADSAAGGGGGRSLRGVVFGGEALDPRSLRPWWETRGEPPRLINMYGITETTVHVTFRPMSRRDAEAGPSSPIGIPIPDLSIYALDRRGGAVPVGVAGELHVGGAGLAWGYLGRPALTAERFVPDPFGAEPGGRLYRSGDLARWRAGGDLEYLGRLDDQVKVRGFRIELGEIEAALREHPAVAAAAVLAREDEPGRRRLVAYLVARPETPLRTAEVRSFLQRKLPDYAMPAAFVELPALPLTANGKLDRRALPEPDRARPDREVSYVAPRTWTEELLCAIWSQVLEVDEVGLLDNFFDLGGDSILALRLVAQAREMGLHLTLQDLFRHQTVAELAAQLSSPVEGLSDLLRTAPLELVAPEDRRRLPGDVVDAYPLAMLQSGMLYHMQENPEEPLYHNVVSWRVRSRFVAEPFREAVARVVARHPVLRTSFHLTGFTVPLQLVHREAVLPVDVEDLRHLALAEQERAVDDRILREKQQLFEWTRTPQIRFHVFLLDEETYQFTLTENHAIIDGWSLHSTLAEIFDLYSELLAGRLPAPRPPLALTYRDFVHLERRTLASEAAEAYWTQVLADAPILELPRWQGAQGPAAATASRAVAIFLTPELLQGLRAAGRAATVPLKSVYLAAHFKALSLLTGQEDLISGLVANGRFEDPEGDDVRGLFLNTLPLRLRLRPSSWIELAQDALRAEREMLPFRRYPLAALQRRWNDRPLFEVSFNHIHFHVVRDMLRSGAVAVTGGQGVEATNFKWQAHFVQAPDTAGVRLQLEHDPRFVPTAQAWAIAACYARILAAIAADPRAPHGADGFLAPAERHQLLCEWNDTWRPRDAEATLTGLIEAQIRKAPTAVAVVFADRTLTCAELSARSNQLARLLRRLGVGPGVAVPLCIERSLEMVVGLLGILKAGGAYVPLDPDSPDERLAFMAEEVLAQGGPPIVLTLERLQGRLEPLRLRRPLQAIALDAGWPEIAAEDEGSLPALATADDLAYVIYTSGSTGRPKAAMNSHRAICNRLLWMQEEYGLDASDRVLQKTPYTFDVSVWEFFWPLMTGARLVLARPDGHREAGYLADLIAGQGITTVHFVPSLLRAFLEQPDLERCRTLRRVVASGEALPPDLQARFFARLDAELHNLYGPTEAAVDVTFHPCERGALSPVTRIGRPIANLAIHLVDSALRPVPLGTAGELCIGGVGLARGYMGRPDLTAERFVPHPFSELPGERLYRTGDLARHLTHGEIEFLGRIDHQVKVRGVRIELGEIETALRALPEVREAVVVAREDAPGVTRLVAYVAGPEIAGEDLRRSLEQTLPEAMIPAAFVVLPDLPRTASGKIDRRALPAPRWEGSRGAAPAGPRSPVEELLVRIWTEVLRCGSVGISDNFFELGGDSILSLQIVARAAQAGCRITSRQIFQHRTIAELARVAVLGMAPAAEVEEVAGPVELTPIQRWFLAQDPVDPHHFNQSLFLEVGETWIGAYLPRVLAALESRHSALRLRFVREAAGWRQSVAPAAGAPACAVVDLSALPEGAHAAALAAAGQVQASLDLARGPLYRAVWFERGAGRSGRLLLVIHHLAVDGVSWRILLDDLLRGCRQARRGEPVDLGPGTMPYSRWSALLHELAGAPETAAEAAWWLARPWQRTGLLAADDPGAPDLVAGAASVVASLEEAETRALLQALPASYRAGVEDALLAALAYAFEGWVDAPALAVDLEGHGREELIAGVDVSRTVGWFTTVYPVILDLGWENGPGKALQALKEQLRRVPRRGLGYGLLAFLREDELAARLAALPPAPIMLNYLGQLDQALPEAWPVSMAAERAGWEKSPRQRRRYLLDLGAGISQGRLWIGCTYGARRFRRERIEELMERVASALRALLAHCSAADVIGFTPSDFPLAEIGQEQLDRLVLRAGRIEDLYPVSPLQHGLLFHALEEPGSGAYFQQLSCEIAGPLDEASFAAAWQGALDRHTILRTGFFWEGVDTPLQVVWPRVDLPLRRIDWSGVPDAGARIEELLAADRSEVFRLSAAPLLRLTLVRLGPDVHRLVWSFHHLILDGWSIPLLLQEVFSAYASRTRGESPALEPALPFRAYIEWLRRQDLATAEAFWRDYLAGFTAATPLTVDRLQPATGAPASRFVEVHELLPPAASARLREMARREQLTLNTLLQGAYGLLLARYSGQPDVVFGAVVAGRPDSLPGVEGMPGMFVNSLPVRVRRAPDAQVAGWLREIQADQVRARQLEHTPLVEVQRWSAMPPRQPLFESLLVFENFPVGDALRERPAERLEVRDLRVLEWTHYPLTILSAPGREEVPVSASYDPARFDPATIHRLLGHLRALLAGFAEAPEGSLGDVPLLSEAELYQLLAWNDSAEPWPAGAVLSRLFEEQVERSPVAVAAEGDRERVSYGELDRRANRLAHRLLAGGLPQEGVVAVLAERGPELLAGLLGVLKAGGTYLPLDPLHPPARLARILARSRASVLLAGSSLLRLGEEALALLEPERPRSGVLEDLLAAPGRDERPAVRSHPESLAYVIFTSGSTGEPKGVMVEHRGMINHLYAKIGTLGLGAGDVVAQTASQCFDISVWQMLSPLMGGGRTRFVSDEVTHDPARLLDGLDEAGATVFETVPSMLAALLDELERRGAARPGLARLRWLIPTGEALGPDLCRRWLAAYPDIPLLNAYGPTECSDDVTHHPIRQAPGEAEAIVPIGRPVANLRLLVTDAERRPLPAGVPGELCVGGVGVGRGYLGEAGRTADVFVPDPLEAEPGGRLYRTGDLARLRADGAIEFLGRLDHQVKIRGYRIELGEIESALVSHPGVRQAVVSAWPEGAPARHLVAHVAGEAPPAPAELRAFLAGRLPEYMVPAFIVALPALPLTANGKVDRKALPAPEDAMEREAGERWQAPLSPHEELLAGLWAQVLGREPRERSADFFALGGHSLLATQLVSRIREAFGVDLPLRAVFEEPALGDLARRVEASRRAGAVPLAAIEPVPRAGDGLPLSFAQERLWFLEQIDPGRATYNIPVAMAVQGPFDPALFEAALAAAIRRQESLRTTFATIEGRPVQRIHPPSPPGVQRVDLSALPEALRRDELRRLASAEASSPFDLMRGPLLRTCLVRLAAAEHAVLFTIHHIVSDGWSTPLLVREIAEHYRGLSTGEPGSLPALPVQYADFAVWQRGRLAGEALDAELSWWRRRLAGAPELLDLPADRPRPEQRTYAGALHTHRLSPELSAALRRLSREEGATLFMTLLAGFQALLHRLTGQSDLVVGTDVANRNRGEVEGLIGFFINHLVLRTDLAGRPTFRELLRRVRETCLEAYDHQDLPFVRLVSALQPRRSLSHMPLFQVLFVLQNAPWRSVEMQGLTLRPVELDWKVARFDLAVFVDEEPDRLTVSWNYSTELFEAATVERMARHFERLLESAGSDPETRISALDVAERKPRAMEIRRREEGKISGLRSGRRRTVDPSLVEPVSFGFLDGGTMPRVIQPNDGDVDLLDWAEGNRQTIESHLQTHGAVLFRGFDLASVSRFEELARAICPDLFGEYGDLPREAEGQKVYRSTPYPSDKTILFHNESSHMHRWPMKQWFFCVKAAAEGGETPIVDCRRIYRSLDPAVAELFETRGLLYQRNFTEGLDVSWQAFFRTSDRAAVESYCRDAGIETEWTAQGLRTRQRCPAVAVHPKTGEKSFFNQIQLHHVSCLEPEVRASLLSVFRPEDLPRNVCFGDGTPIDDALVREILDLYWEHAVSFPWQEGDVLMVDNMLTAHARNPFKGERKIVVAMGELVSKGALQ